MGYDKVRKKFEGKVFESKSSGKFKVLKYTDRNNILIEFLSTGYRKTTSNGCIKNGNIRDLWRASVEGKGVNDSITHVERKLTFPDGSKVVWTCPIYARWKGMLRRCYNKDWLKRYPSYKDCKVCPSWLLFSNFKSWAEKREWEGMHLDKDIVGDGKVYSPENRVFIHPDVNTLITEATTIRGEFPLGVMKSHDRLVVKCRDPYFDKQITLATLQERDCIINFGHNLWKTYKQSVVSRMWLDGKINDINVFEALMVKYSYTGHTEKLQKIVRGKLKERGVDLEGIFELMNSFESKFLLQVEDELL